MTETSRTSGFAFLSNMQTKHKYAIAGGVGVVAIVGITLGVVFGTQSNEEDPTCRSFTAPSDVKFTEQEDGLLLNWSSPSNSRGCTVKYQLSYTIDGGSEVVEEVNEANYLFDVSVLEPCTEIEVQLVALTESGSESDAVQALHTIEVAENFGFVSDIKLSEIQHELSAEWTVPMGFNKCQVLYKLVVGTTIKITGDAFYKFSDVVLEYCKTTTVSIIPMVKDTEGVPKEAEINPVVEEYFGLADDISLSSRDGKTEISWTAPAGFKTCPIQYNVTFYDGYWLAGEQVVEDLEVAVFDFTPTKCVNITMFVTPMIGEIYGIENSVFYIVPVEEGFAKVTNIELMVLGGVLTGFWRPPPEYFYCLITYVLTVGEDVFETVGTSYSFYNTTIKFCDDTSITVSILPTVDDILGLPEEATFEEPVDSGFYGIEPPVFTEVDGKLKMTLEVTPEYIDCDVSFEIQVDEGSVIQTNDLEVSLDITLDKCAEYNILVTPVIGEFRGEEKTKTYVAGVTDSFAPIENLQLAYINDDFILTWDRPQGFDTCRLTYRIDVNSEYFLQGVTATNIIVPGFKLTKCLENEVQITPIIVDNVGIPATRTQEASVQAGFKLVENLVVNEDDYSILNATWEMALEYSNCSVEYEVQLDAQVIDVVQDGVYIFEETMESCREYEVKIIPLIGDVRGYEKIINHYSDPGFVGHVNNPRIVADKEEDTLKITWDPPDYLDQCDLSYEVVITVDEEDVYKEIVPTTEWISERPFSYFCYAYGIEATIYGVYGDLPNRGYIVSESCN